MNKEPREGTVLDFDQLADKYKPETHILLMPQVSKHLLTLTPMYSLDVATYKVDPTNKKHIHPIKGDDTMLGLSKLVIDAIALAADVSIVPTRVDQGFDRMHAIFSATAMMETPSGGRRGVTRSAEWEGEALMQKMRLEAHAHVNKKVQYDDEVETPAGYKKAKELTDEQFAATVEFTFQSRWINEQIYGKRKAESAACSRAIRALLGIQTAYPKIDLQQKEFAIVRFVFTPPVDGNPELLNAVVMATMAARGMLYPGTEIPRGGAAAITGGMPTMQIPYEGTVAPLEFKPAPADVTPAEPTPDFSTAEPEPEPDPILKKIAAMREGLKLVKDQGTLTSLRSQLNKMEEATDRKGISDMYEWMKSNGYIEGGTE